MIGKISTLKTHGACFSLDDFGTGASSLSFIKRLLDPLKVDQSFVRDVLIDANDAYDATIARTVVALGKSLGLSAFAEGVKTAGQRDFLQQHGCIAYQRYFFSRPLTAARFAVYLERHFQA